MSQTCLLQSEIPDAVSISCLDDLIPNPVESLTSGSGRPIQRTLIGATWRPPALPGWQ
jgi:hypothetical protein